MNNGKCSAMLFLVFGLALAPTVVRAGSFSLPLTTGDANKLDLGLFAAGTSLNIIMSGHGDLVDSQLQVNADGSLFAPAQGPYVFANPGAAYPTVDGGDGINHFIGGGLNYDATGTGYPFAGKMTTDTEDPAAIRDGVVVGTFSATPTRNDWFVIGLDSTIVIPSGGAHLYVAVNESYSPDNHGAFSGILTISVVPEPASAMMLGIGCLGIVYYLLRLKKGTKGAGNLEPFTIGLRAGVGANTLQEPLH